MADLIPIGSTSGIRSHQWREYSDRRCNLEGAGIRGAACEGRENLQEAIELILEANRALTRDGLVGKRVIREQLPVSG
ncbi:MAG: hypothetical protein LC732_05060 [Acidobacteria bacterium]|nr:hypothetical protein [Acidobacteriota bacterium]